MNSLINDLKKHVTTMLGPDCVVGKKVLTSGTDHMITVFNELSALETVGTNVYDSLEKWKYEDNTFDIIYISDLEYSNSPKKTFSEIERVLKVGGNVFLQCQLHSKKFDDRPLTIVNPIYDVLPLTNTLFCNGMGSHEKTSIGVDFSFLFTKDENLTNLYEKHGDLYSIEVPDRYQKIWDTINLPIQTKKLDNSMIYDENVRSKILNNLSKRAYYLTRVAEAFSCNKIAEVGTAEGYQFYSFCNYIKEIHEGNVSTCDPRDVRNKLYKNIFDETYFTFYNGTSKEMSKGEGIKDFFYVDGLHDENSVLTDIFYLQDNQTKDRLPVWVFDDFDVRFGCFNDILKICNASRQFKVYKVGNTASGQPSHQAIIVSHLGLQ